ncbi:hypothetical protein [Halotalea alkalilenta]|uniref:Uncharacterized protein n=1 Tax=Halotalea alkalilenta TaxID=376489 RepID=A0A172YHX8_9GAMM|nr:hypothetical protein [Halotalea alkalilenta]ANF58742.1 hypothetical protein A5892_15745 [Halotalea alkalilenta]
MAIDPVNSANTGPAADGGEADFNKALDNASANASDSDAQLDETMAEGIVQVGGQMILMPIANDIFKESQSDDE